MDRSSSYYIGVIPRRFLIWIVLGVAIGDLFSFQDKMVLHIVTQVINCYVTVVASTQHKVSVNHLRVRISENIGLQGDV